jgi:hypothetical protein
MSAHQIKSEITEIVSHIEDENELKACLTFVKGYRRQSMPVTKVIKTSTNKGKTTTPKSVRFTVKLKKNVVPHDLSLVLLANDLFKGSESLSETGEIAFEKAFKKSLKKEPSLPNRL